MTEKEQLMKRLALLEIHAYDLLRRSEHLQAFYPDTYRELIEDIRAIEKLKRESRTLK